MIAIIDTKNVVIIGDLFNSSRFCDYLRAHLVEYELHNIWQNIKIRPQDNDIIAPIALGINKFIIENYNSK
ncbi:hypothetical protein AN639_02980 [Candidatus Epulonipiscium fishelsonii]|uniref:Uncharacterized protein n=1 Tax=Candidatus Epulonipiscium fishelsonii TaxID=77094 RepID=A0ACC8XD52_9FIRM|nr:hypothetical protein AN396_05670 [Epulopiscium sp. SCG-B11WGA-EpuloA1]ONI41793.1 hypothetical protein AN639_02980 [Epulopiscium sp. SCG-B05WGA-EpuloA1]